jgi:hypothetical protein
MDEILTLPKQTIYSSADRRFYLSLGEYCLNG